MKRFDTGNLNYSWEIIVASLSMEGKLKFKRACSYLYKEICYFHFTRGSVSQISNSTIWNEETKNRTDRLLEKTRYLFSFFQSNRNLNTISQSFQTVPLNFFVDFVQMKIKRHLQKYFSALEFQINFIGEFILHKYLQGCHLVETWHSNCYS